METIRWKTITLGMIYKIILRYILTFTTGQITKIFAVVFATGKPAKCRPELVARTAT